MRDRKLKRIMYRTKKESDKLQKEEKRERESEKGQKRKDSEQERKRTRDWLGHDIVKKNGEIKRYIHTEERDTVQEIRVFRGKSRRMKIIGFWYNYFPRNCLCKKMQKNVGLLVWCTYTRQIKSLGGREIENLAVCKF